MLMTSSTWIRRVRVKPRYVLKHKKRKGELGNLVRQSLEDPLNALLDAEADRLTNASRYERTEGRKDTRAGSYHRKLLSKAGEVDLKVPRLLTLPFESAIIDGTCGGSFIV